MQEIDSKHWRERAEATRIKAQNVSRFNPAKKQMLLRVAEEYDRLADRAARCQTTPDSEEHHP